MDPLYELLTPYFDTTPSSTNSQTNDYLTRLATLSLPSLTTTEPASLLQSAHSHLRNLQALSKRSHRAVIASSSHLSNLTSLLPSLEAQAQGLRDELPGLAGAATEFGKKYERRSTQENTVLDRRKKVMLLSRNVDRVADVLDLPTLLASTVSAAQASTEASTSSTATSYGSALDLHAHIKRLNALYPSSELVGYISTQAEAEIQNLTTILITSLQSPQLKLAGAMRTIGWLRRVAPDLADDGYSSTAVKSTATGTSTKPFNLPTSTATRSTMDDGGALGSLFLICRLHTLHTTLSALEPLRELADQEGLRRKQGTTSKLLKQHQVSASALGSQSERYLKRYIEIFREQSFGIVSMYRSIFPQQQQQASTASAGDEEGMIDTDAPPSPLSSFALHLVDTLTATLRAYIPNITDKSARESLLMQVLYCAGSLGRLGADFGMMTALLLEEEEDEPLGTGHGRNEDSAQAGAGDKEWVQVMKKHRVQASRLEVLARGVGSGARKASGGGVDLVSPTAAVSP